MYFSLKVIFTVIFADCRCLQAALSEEELVGVEQASATAAEVTGSMMRLKLELEEKKRTVGMLQAALVRKKPEHRRRSAAVSVELSPSAAPRVSAEPAEGADGETREGDGEGAEQELPAAEGAVRSHHPETPDFHRPGGKTLGWFAKTLFSFLYESDVSRLSAAHQ